MADSRQRILILGASGFSLEVAEVVEQLPGFRVAGFVQSLWPERRGETIEGYPVYYIDELPGLVADHRAVTGTGSPQRAAFVEQVERTGMRFATIVHPLATVSPRSKLGEGCVLLAGTVVGARAALGRHVILNRNSSVGHDTQLAEHVFLGPGATVAGSCRLGAGCFVGAGAVIRDHLTVGENCFVGAGAAVLNNAPPRVIVSAPRSSILE